MRPLSLSCRRLPTRSKSCNSSRRSSSLMAALVADCESEMAAAAPAVLPLSATTRKICSCRSVSRRAFMTVTAINLRNRLMIQE